MPPFWLIGILARAGVASRFQKAAAWLLAVAFFALLGGAMVWGFRGWVHGREDQAVEIDRKDVTIEAANRVINATYEADRQQAERDRTFANSQEGLRDEVRTKGTDAAVGPATAGVLERLRREQDAARRGDAAR